MGLTGRLRPLFATLMCACCLLAGAQSTAGNPDDLALLTALSGQFARLAPQTVHPAIGQIPNDFLIPAGYYQQMWDWDSFFIGAHWANQDPADAKYLQWWTLNYARFIDADGYVAACITSDGPRPILFPAGGKFAMKPFLAQGAFLASEQLHDYTWLASLWDKLERVAAYRERTQFDPKWGLYYWENAMQSGADNNAALSNDPKDPNAILAVDASVWALREDLAMAEIAEHLGHTAAALEYRRKAAALKAAIMKNLWLPQDAMFWNRRRDNGAWVKRMSWSSFIPLSEGLVPQADGRRMIQQHLLNSAEMRSSYGFRSLSKGDPEYNNRAIIVPYSNWQGPIWINANYLDWLALRRYGFPVEARWTAVTIAQLLRRDINKWGSMHEDYDAETGDGLAPTPEQSKDGRFAGFVGWNLLAQDMLQCEVTRQQCKAWPQPR